MTDSNEHLLDSPSVDSESPLERLLRKHGLTEQEFDDVAQRRFNGFYPLTYKYFGISRKEIENMDKKVPVKIQPEFVGGEKTFDSGVSVKLGERALHLLAADKANAGYLRASGFKRALNSPYKESIQRRYTGEEIRRIAGSQQSYIDDFHSELSEAFGLDKIVRLGGVSPTQAEGWERADERKFINKFDGPDGKKARTKFLKAWKHQLK